MHIVFIIQRINNYRMLSSLVAQGLKKGCTVECWHLCDPANMKGEKGYLYPDSSKTPFDTEQYPNLSIIPFSSLRSISNAVADRSDITHIVSLSPPEFIIEEDDLKKFRGYWCIIMHGPDSFKEIGGLAETAIDPGLKRIFFPYTQHFFDRGMMFSKQFLPLAETYFSPENTLVKPVGCTMFDDRLACIDRDKVRRKYNIPAGKNIVIYLPYAFEKSKKKKQSRAWQNAFSEIHVKRKARREFHDGGHEKLSASQQLSKYISAFSKILPDKRARTTLFKGWHEPAVINALRAFCDTNDLYLVVKPRRKFDFSEAVHRKADIIIDDDESQQYPSKLQELFTITSLTVALFSTAAIECPFISMSRW